MRFRTRNKISLNKSKFKALFEVSEKMTREINYQDCKNDLKSCEIEYKLCTQENLVFNQQSKQENIAFFSMSYSEQYKIETH